MVPVRISRNLYVAGKENLPFLGWKGRFSAEGSRT